MLAKEALLISEATIMRCPEFVVGIISSRVISTLALRLVELWEIDVDKEGLIAFLDIDLDVIFTLVDELMVLFSVGSVDHKLLRDTVGLYDDVLNIKFPVRDS